MTTLTIAPAGSAFSADPFYAMGRADAHDEADALTLTELTTRALTLLDHVTPATPAAQRLYTAGYARRTAELTAEHAATITVQSGEAQTRLARKQGRETSPRTRTSRNGHRS